MGVYVVFLTSRGWDFIDLEGHDGSPRSHEYEIEGLSAFMAWANKHLNLSQDKTLDEDTLARMAKRLQGGWR